jgi:hypothetical protein
MKPSSRSRIPKEMVSLVCKVVGRRRVGRLHEWHWTTYCRIGGRGFPDGYARPYRAAASLQVVLTPLLGEVKVRGGGKSKPDGVAIAEEGATVSVSKQDSNDAHMQSVSSDAKVERANALSLLPSRPTQLLDIFVANT